MSAWPEVSASRTAYVEDAHHAPSIISSRMTDIVSEDGDEYHPAGATAAAQSRPRAPSGAQNNASRPSSSRHEIWSRPPPSRRGGLGLESPSSHQQGNPFGGPGSTISSTSRPQSPTPRTSRSHAPSLTSHAFFRPMSSQRLQAQRNGRPLTSRRYGADRMVDNEFGSAPHRKSIGSTQTRPTTNAEDELPPPSRGTEFTELDAQDRAVNVANITQHAATHSVGDSTRPLYQPSRHERLMTLDRGNDVSRDLKTQASLQSFKSSKLPPGKRGLSVPYEARGQGRASPGVLIQDSEPYKTNGREKKLAGHVYDYFPGNTSFCLGGRLQNTRDRPVNIATGILVVLPAVLFLVYSGPYYWRNVSPAVTIIFAYLFFICISSFVHASVTDPGILPRNLHPLPTPENADDPLTIGPSMTEWTMIKSAGSATSAMEVPTKYCKSCNVWRPPRAHHCRVCDNCVETQDHHCVWLNNCVGRRNYRYFFTFVASGALLGIFLMFGSLGHCLRYHSTENVAFDDAIDDWRVPFAMFLYGLLITPYPTSLLAYHLFLLGRGETTREYLNSHTFLKVDRHRPFTQGKFYKNWIVALMRPRPPTYLRFRDVYLVGDQRLGPRRTDRQERGAEMQQSGGLEMRDVATSFQGPSKIQQNKELQDQATIS